METIYDLVAIGGGTAALVATLGVAGVGGTAALIEVDKPGGDCLWTGCVPSKALLAAAGRAHAMRTASEVGIAGVEPEIEFGAVMAHVRATQAAIEPHDSPERLTAAGVDVIKGRGEFVEPGVIKVGDRTIRYRAALIATGSQPVLPPIPGLADASPLTSHNVWDLDVLPKRLIVLGGGPIGCELGQAFSRLGSEVALVEAQPTLLPNESAAVGDHIASVLRAEGVDVRTGTMAVGVTKDAHVVALELDDGSIIEADQILVATGRRPNTVDLGLKHVGVDLDERGSVIVDDTMRTTGDRIFAAGDVTGKMPFTPVAGHQARLIVTNALYRVKRKAAYDNIPWVTFTDPEIGRVGLDGAAARAKWGKKAVVERVEFSALDRAITHGRTGGWVELVGDPKRRIVGATIVGEAAGESIAEVVAFMANGAKIDQISTTVHAYPTLTEGASRAADNVLRTVYFSPRMKRASSMALKVLRRF